LNLPEFNGHAVATLATRDPAVVDLAHDLDIFYNSDAARILELHKFEKAVRPAHRIRRNPGKPLDVARHQFA